MIKLSFFIVFLSLALAAFAQDQEDQCSSYWVGSLYEKCEIKDDPIEFERDLSVECPGDPSCVPIYPTCAHPSHGFEWAGASSPLNAQILETGFVKGGVPGQKCQELQHKRNQSLRADGQKIINIAYVSEENSCENNDDLKLDIDCRYNYQCRAEMVQYPAKIKENSEVCGDPVDYVEPEIPVEFANRRDPSCEETVLFFLPATAPDKETPPWYKQQLADEIRKEYGQNSLASGPLCITCEELDFQKATTKEVAQCFVSRWENYVVKALNDDEEAEIPEGFFASLLSFTQSFRGSDLPFQLYQELQRVHNYLTDAVSGGEDPAQ